MSLETVHFLLVDDLEENLMALEALLRRDGLTLLKARSGPEALELLLQHDVALALIDVQMPEMNGFELAELMRGNSRSKKVPIIFVTAASEDQQRRFRGYEAGAVDFLQKPIETDILKSKADVFFELHRQRQEVARHCLELETANEKTRHYAAALTEADRKKDEFLATLAHELRNPLAPIQRGLEILNREPNAETAEKVRNVIERQLRHMVSLVDDLLDISRISNGKIDLRKSVMAVRDAVVLAVEIADPLILDGGHTLTVDLPDEPIWVNGDLNRLGQVIGNLLNNAAKYTQPGGHIILTATQQEGQAIITVADNGVGIPAEKLESIFDLFSQVDLETRSAAGGLGIGLSLVKNLVNLHDGEIEASSAGINQGSVFTIRLPLAQAPQGQVRENERTASGGSGPLRILVVDDNISSAQTTGWLLEMLGHSFMLAHDGPEAVALAEKEQPDVILLDIGLPGMSGYDVCRTLREKPEFRDTLIIAQTGWGRQSDREKAHEAGFNHHLVKPIKMEDIIGLLGE